MARRTQTAETDAPQWEYVTYPPDGQTCPACQEKVKPLEPCRRSTIERASGATVVAYRHVHCDGNDEIKR
ncbi:hypothetical protein [Streptomyces abikoensis]|uniref:hypothetical protein n=1 Tax=Streptomyces abikoensis TaxID=97398 RepID=UPI00167C303A|nr:hypothetical protein [Streptomyces abikoensis]GGP75709.1 hypothetical protein GCM10010214_58720 [Streptomyces abikoensis]